MGTSSSSSSSSGIGLALIIFSIIALVAFWPKPKVKIIKRDQSLIEPRKSKFMQKLDAAIEANQNKQQSR